MNINGVEIEDTFAEAFAMKAVRLLITACNEKWAMIAAKTVSGFATSIIGCNCEGGIDFTVPPDRTPDGRPGVMVPFFFMSRESAEQHLLYRVGQAIMTSPTSACYDGLGMGEPIKIGGKLRYFGDGYQASKLVDGRRLWRVPVMDGEFLVEESFHLADAVGGGNFLILAETQDAALAAAEAAVEVMEPVEGAILPFPGGVVRSGSKVGSRYKGQFVSTNTAYCPTLRGVVEDSALPEGVGSVMEIVIDGLDEAAVSRCMAKGIRAACLPGVVRISAGNYGGKLGQYHFRLRDVLG